MEIPFFVKYGQVVFWTSPVSECQKGFRISSEPHVVIGRVFPPPSCWGWTESCEGDGWIATDGAHTWSFALDRVEVRASTVWGTTRRCYWEKQGLIEFNDWSGSVLFLFFFLALLMSHVSQSSQLDFLNCHNELFTRLIRKQCQKS